MRKIIHIDADCFFAAVELIDKPHLRHLPVAVGGSPQGRGVITTCNYIARAYGVRSAMPSSHALRICPDLNFLSPNMQAYKLASQAIMEILARFTSKVQVVSIDEAFLDVSDTGHFGGSATLIAHEIQRTVKAELGLDISAGVAPCKYLAKIASDWNKPAGIFTIAPSDIPSFLFSLDLKHLPGVGPKTLQKLHSLGLHTCNDVNRAKPEFLYKRLGSFAKPLLDMSNGIDERKVVSERRSKSLSIERTFAENIDTYPALIQQIPQMIEQLEQRYNKSGSERRPVKRVLKLKFADFSATSVEAGLSSFGELLDKSEFERLTYIAKSRANLPVRLLGLGLRFAQTERSSQLELPFSYDN